MSYKSQCEMKNSLRVGVCQGMGNKPNGKVRGSIGNEN